MKPDIQVVPNHLSLKLIQWRRQIHQHAESGWTEFWTSSFIADQLHEWGWHVMTGQDIHGAERMGVPPVDILDQCYHNALTQGANPKWMVQMKGGFTGVVADLQVGRKPDIVLRFDIDANDMDESDDKDHIPVKEGFRSVNPGSAHCCGHDAHAAIGLGVAHVLGSLKKNLKSNIRLIFQPAEEGVRGAKSMTEAGLVDGTKAFLGFHIGTKASKSGNIVLGTGKFLATTKFDVYFTGTSAHAGMQPDQGENCLLAAANAALNLHAIPRHPDGATRISVGTMTAGTGRNVIPSCAKLQVETRGDTSELDQYMLDKARTVVQHSAGLYGPKWKFRIQGQAKNCDSSSEMILVLSDVVKKVECFSPENITNYIDFGGSEDVTFFMDRVKTQGGIASYILLGTDMPSGHHTPTFDIDERVLPSGVDFLIRSVLRLDQEV